MSQARRIRSVWLLAVGLVVAVLFLVAVLTSGSSPTPAPTPEDVAARWTQALLRGEGAGAGALTCPGSDDVRRYGLLVVDTATVHAQRARRITANRWSVTVNLIGRDGALLNALPLTVERVDGGLKVC